MAQVAGARLSGVGGAKRERASEAELSFVTVDTSQPAVLDYDAADGGKTAYYWLRWVNPTGERGPWSEPAAATLAAAARSTESRMANRKAARGPSFRSPFAI